MAVKNAKIKLLDAKSINSIYNTGKKRTEEGKRNYLSDENAMRKAEKLIYSEFSRQKRAKQLWHILLN